MHQLVALLWWTLISFISTCIALLIGYGLAWLATMLITVLLLFLLFGAAPIGLLIGSGTAGAIVGWIIAQVQQSILAERQPPNQRWRATSMWIWAIAGCVCSSALIPLIAGDVAPLLPILLAAAMIASSALWFLLAKHHVPAANWWGSLGMLGTVSGTLAALFLLGALNGRVPSELLAGLKHNYHSITQVKATRLVELNGRLLVFVEIEDALQLRQWELWSSDGTSQGTTHLKTGYTGWDEGRIYQLVVIDNKLYFEAEGSEEREKGNPWLKTWITDGTPAGSRPLSSRFPYGPEPHVSQIGMETPQLTLGSTTYFVVQKTKRSIELWRRDAGSGQETLIKAFP